MSLFQSVLVALDMLRLHKLRAFLTMFGVIIGVMAVTMTVMRAPSRLMRVDIQGVGRWLRRRQHTAASSA